MKKLRVFSGKELCDILAKNGFTNVRQKGSHIVMQKKIGHATITTIVPNHSEIRIGTLLSIIRQSNLPREIFEV